MGLKSFSAVGKISSIGEIKKFNDITYLEVSILIEPSTQILDFYLTETKDTPHAFQLIRKYFGEYGAFKINEKIQFDFNIVKNKKNETKLKIWSIYNKGFYGMESRNSTEVNTGN